MIYKTGITRDFFVFCRRQICLLQESFVMLRTDRSLIWMWTIRADVVNFSKFAGKINEKEEKMKADSITSPIRKQGFRASMTVKW